MSAEDADVFDFYEKLGVGEKWEKLLEPHLGKLVWEEAQRISYSDNPTMQKDGIDHVLIKREFPDDALQCKVITQKYDNIFYETRHEIVDGSGKWVGWVYEYDRVILWAWLSGNERRIKDARWLLVNDDFREWFNRVMDNYPEKRGGKPTEKDGRRWWSYGVTIPLADIDSRFIREAGEPPIGLKSDTEQTELLNFNDG